MSKNLLIVESPAKGKTIKKYLGPDFDVLASYGHVRDLVPKEGAVDTENDFAMKYQVITKNSKHMDKIAQMVKQAETVYLSTDPDREGEAISWHILEYLNQKKLLKGKEVFRVVFHEITKAAVTEAVENPRGLSMDLVNAQQARRALDYLVGFNLSPLLWKKIRRGLSAGRVQSPALRVIVEREQEIARFESREYWTIKAQNNKDKQDFLSKLILLADDKISQFSITDETTAMAAKEKLLGLANGKLKVTSLSKKQRRRNPSPPFITSTLQQEAARKLGFSAKRTMVLAQQLYEGIDTGSGAEGLITYMRTDSVNLSEDALAQIREYIATTYGQDQLPKDIRVFKTKSKNAQEAHEAIRPTTITKSPKSIESYLNKDQLKLYGLIWKRSIACQMIHATIDTVSADLACGEGNLFRANGSTIAKPGFLQVYEEGVDDPQKDQSQNGMLPAMKEGDLIDVNDILAEQHFTEPPPRFSEASLIKFLEEMGIGRPSTYASIISVIQDREYVVLDSKRFKPTDVGEIVTKFLVEHFNQYVDYQFTARLEDDLDAVSRGEKGWKPLLKEFWSPFDSLVHEKEASVKRSDVTQEAMDEKCPKCDKMLNKRLGRHGRFVGCSGYPDCDYTRNLDGSTNEPEEAEIVEGRSCPDCGSDLVFKKGRYGKFIGCSSYPKCKHIEPLEKPVDTGVSCPECNKGTLMQRKSRRGKVFYSCSGYPKCKYAIWNPPVAEACPNCQWPIQTLKTTKRRGTEKVCPQKECGHSLVMEPPEGGDAPAPKPAAKKPATKKSTAKKPAAKKPAADNE